MERSGLFGIEGGKRGSHRHTCGLKCLRMNDRYEGISQGVEELSGCLCSCGGFHQPQRVCRPSLRGGPCAHLRGSSREGWA